MDLLHNCYAIVHSPFGKSRSRSTATAWLRAAGRRRRFARDDRGAPKRGILAPSASRQSSDSNRPCAQFETQHLFGMRRGLAHTLPLQAPYRGSGGTCKAI